MLAYSFPHQPYELLSMYRHRAYFLVLAALFIAVDDRTSSAQNPAAPEKPKHIEPMEPAIQWGGTSLRNNVSLGVNVATDWDVGKYDRKKREFVPGSSRNIKWRSRLGSQTYATPLVAGGKVFVGSNNSGAYLERYDVDTDLGVMLCFDQQTGEFLWQHSNKKLSTGRVHDWPYQGIISVPCVQGNRLWYVTNRGEVVCLDTEGFRDSVNDGWQGEEVVADNEADVVWRLDMMEQLGTRQHNACTCSPTIADGVLFVITGNGVDEGHLDLIHPYAPSFIAIDAVTGKLLWSDNSPGKNVLHGQWSSPSHAVLGGVPQVLFPGGDGWLYSFDPKGNGAGKSKLLWKFDCNPKTSLWKLGGQGTRNSHITLPVIDNEKVYVAVGQDVEHGSGIGQLWCIDPTRYSDGSDVSPTLAFQIHQEPIKEQRRFQAVDPNRSEYEVTNPRSALIWCYQQHDENDDGVVEFEEAMHRACGPVAVHDGLVVIADSDGLVHCLDAKTGKGHWIHDTYAQVWAAAPLIVDGKIYIGNEDGDVLIFELATKKRLINTVSMDASIYSSASVADNVLFITTKSHLFAIEAQ